MLVVFTSCSRKKAGFTHRLYHNTTSHYNWYFNATEIMKNTNTQLHNNKEEDYLELLPVYVLPNEEEQKNLFPTMDQIIEKCSTIIDRHSLEVKRDKDKRKKEHNKWIDDSYLLIGKANYYKGRYSTAIEMFSYTAKKYKGEDSRFDAAIWLARTYVEIGKYSKAITVLSVIESDKGKDKPDDFEAKLATVYADMYLRQERFKEALPYIDDAATYTEEKREKVRMTFILAQVYNQLNRSQDAIESYGRVVDLRPEYEIEFYAKISQALSYDRKLNPQKIKDMLWAMAKDEKNEEYYDQIYYALGEIEYESQHIEEAIDHYKTSTRKSVGNPKQKGKSFLRLAEIHFNDRQYEVAKNYYDSTTTYLPEDFPNYETIAATGESLIGLVDNLQTIERNDSLLALVDMSDKEREKKILDMIVKLEEEEDERRQKELEALERIQNAPPAGGKKGYGSGKNWYFYNASTIGSGYQEFQRKWGSRKLEDNWRRSNKASEKQQDEMQDAVADSAGGALAGANQSSIKSLDEYLAELPMSDSAYAATHNQIIDALYNVGTIYKERLKDDDNATESFLRITSDYDTSATAPSAFYQLYRIYLEKEESGQFVGTGFRDNSEYYKNVILADYPNSEYAKLILNPDYGSADDEKYAEEKAAYEEIYKKYSRRQYNDVIMACNSVIQEEPNNNFLGKYYLVKALTIGERKDAGSYENILKEIVTKFSGTEEGEKAAELLGELNKAKSRLAQQKDDPKDDDNLADKDEKDDKADDVNTSMFKVDEDSEHFFAVVFPKTEGNATTIKESIADFHAAYFRTAKLRITNSFIDKDHQIIIVRSFDNADQAMEYYDTFKVNTEELKEINEKDYAKFAITTKNFTVLFRNKNADVYSAFFSQNYL